MSVTKAKPPIVQAFKQLFNSARVYTWALVVAIAGLLVARLAEAAIYKYLIPQTLDEGLIAQKVEFLQHMPLMFFGIFGAIGLGEFLSKYFMGYVGRSVVRDYRQQMLAHLLVVPVSYYKKHTIGELISKINFDAEQVALAVSESVREFLNSVVAIVVLVGVMFSISWRVTLVMLLVVPFFTLVMRKMGKKMRRYSSKVQQSMGELTHVSAEVITGHQVIKVYQGDAYELQRIRTVTENNCQQELKTFLVSALSQPLIQGIGAAVLIGFIYLVKHQTINLPPGQIFGLIGIMFALIRPLKQIGGVNNILQKGIAGINSIQQLLQTPAEKNLHATQLTERPNELVFKDVSFAYSDAPDTMVLKHINLVARRGQTIALVGGSGSGKSSLISLIPRFYELSAGQILIDNQDIAQLDLSNLRQQIAVITQHIVLFNDTVANNIAYGLPNATLDQIKHAARVAQALDFIEKLPHGFNTPIGENGCLLSGGQRQRIAIARAVLKDAAILIMDEATSALDTEAELAVKQALSDLMFDRITIVIAHRLSTIEQADQILVLEHGSIVEAGTHQELLLRSGRYAQLQQAQQYNQEPQYEVKNEQAIL